MPFRTESWARDKRGVWNLKVSLITVTSKETLDQKVLLPELGCWNCCLLLQATSFLAYFMDLLLLLCFVSSLISDRKSHICFPESWFSYLPCSDMVSHNPTMTMTQTIHPVPNWAHPLLLLSVLTVLSLYKLGIFWTLILCLHWFESASVGILFGIKQEDKTLLQWFKYILDSLIA